MKQFLYLIFLFPAIVFGQSIDKVSSIQNGNTIDINYQLNGFQDNQLVTVNLYYAVNDSDYIGPLLNVKGDVGENVSIKGDKTIKWDVIAEIGLLEGQTKFKVEAIPAELPSVVSTEGTYFSVAVEKCVLEGSTLTMDVALTSAKDSYWVFSTDYAYIKDKNGKKYFNKKFKWDEQTGARPKFYMAKGEPVKMQIIYENVDADLDHISSFEITDVDEWFGSPRREALKVKDIPVIK